MTTRSNGPVDLTAIFTGNHANPPARGIGANTSHTAGIRREKENRT